MGLINEEKEDQTQRISDTLGLRKNFPRLCCCRLVLSIVFLSILITHNVRVATLKILIRNSKVKSPPHQM